MDSIIFGPLDFVSVLLKNDAPLKVAEPAGAGAGLAIGAVAEGVDPMLILGLPPSILRLLSGIVFVFIFLISLF
jgi:hypothetical protein